MARPRAVLTFALLICAIGTSMSSIAADRNANTDWLRDARVGVFMHLLPGDLQGLERVNRLDVDALAAQLESVGAKYFVLTLGQNSGFMNSPNATYERITGYQLGERCSTRDLPLDLYRVLNPKGIQLMLGSSWSKRDTRYPAKRWADWVGKVIANGGVVTLDAGPNWDPQAGPIGAISEDQMAQLRSIQAAVKAATTVAESYVDPAQLDCPWPQHSFCKQPWRGFLEVRSGEAFLRGIGVNYHSPGNDEVAIRLLAETGVRAYRYE